MLNTLKKIAFERVGGTSEEKRVFEILAGEVEKRGLEPVFESFEVRTFRAGEGRITLDNPEETSFPVNPVGLSGSADVSGSLKYIEPNALPYAEDCEGKIVLLSRGVRHDDYKKLRELGVAAFVLVNSPGKLPGYPALKAKLVEKYGVIPGAVISYESGLRLISNAGGNARLQTNQEEFTGESRNLMVTVPGEIEDQDVVICAHADSVADSPGAVDNGAGCVELLGLLGHFAANRPRRTIRFCFFGSEELGLQGSREYVRRHADELENIALVINLDLGGDIFGNNRAIITGPEKLGHYIDGRSKLRGLGLKVSMGIYSSDNMPFAKKGIPALSFGRSGLGASLGHSSQDDLRNVDEKSLRSMAGIALDFADELVNAKELPFEREIPENIRESVVEYFEDKYGPGEE